MLLYPLEVVNLQHQRLKFRTNAYRSRHYKMFNGTRQIQLELSPALQANLTTRASLYNIASMTNHVLADANGLPQEVDAIEGTTVVLKRELPDFNLDNPYKGGVLFRCSKAMAEQGGVLPVALGWIDREFSVNGVVGTFRHRKNRLLFWTKVDGIEITPSVIWHPDMLTGTAHDLTV